MNLAETEKFLTYKNQLFPNFNKDFDPDTVEFVIKMWQRAFIDFSYKDCCLALEYWFNTEKYPPSPVDLKEILAKTARASVAQSPERAWQTVDRAVRRYGSYGKDKAFATFTDATKNAVLNVGGWQKICETQLGQPWDFLRKNFIEAYKDFDQEREMVERLPSPIVEKLLAQQAKLGDGS